MNKSIIFSVLLTFLLGLLVTACNNKEPQALYAAGEEWRHFNGNPASSHFSSLRQINKDNVSKLEKAWEYHSDDGVLLGNGFNPLIVNGVMYAGTSGGGMAALNPSTGEQLWLFHPEYKSNTKGANYWQDAEQLEVARILFAGGPYLHAVNAQSGKPVMEFGLKGKIDMGVSVTSPGVIYNNLLILGSSGGARGAGQIRAYDVRTGDLVWAFQTIPQKGEPGYETWGEIGANYAKGANAWTSMSLDQQRGVVYVATAQPKVESKAADFFGGDWPGRNRFANSVIAINAETGELIWDFQEVYHDIWDFDLPAAPNLVRVKYQGQDIDAVAQVTKTGNTLLLNRDTGKLLYPAEERPAPASSLPEENAYPTQRVFTRPEPFAKTEFTRDDITDLNPEAHKFILERFEASRTGWFVPPSLEGNILFGPFGGAEWGGAAYDPESHHLYVNSNHIPWYLRMQSVRELETEALDTNNANKRALGKPLYQQHCAVCHGEHRQGQGHIPPLYTSYYKYDEQALANIVAAGRGMMPAFATLLDKDQRRAVAAFVRYNGSRALNKEAMDYVPPYVTAANGQNVLRDPEGYPGSKPPWGTLNAINLDTGKIDWRVPLGEYPELKKRGIAPTGTMNFGGSVATAGGLLFIAATADEMFRAFDKETGEVLWETKLPFAGYATPATYMMDGRQYVVIAASGGGHNGTPLGDTWIAFALKEERE